MKAKKIIIAIVALLIVLILLVTDMFLINPKVVTANTKTLTSSKLDASFDDFTIVFFSDVHYGTSIGLNEFSQMVDLINSFDAELVLFGGDLFDDLLNYSFDEDEEASLIAELSRIEASHGKFYVLGNHDLGSTEVYEAVLSYMDQADFELLNNSSTRIYVDDAYINLVGIDSALLGEPDIENAYSDIDSEYFTISICHTPDTFAEVPYADIMFAGHSHGGQIYLPFLNNFYRPKGAETYFKGTYYDDDKLLHVSNGVGTTLFDGRLFADSEILVYKLKAS